MQSDMSSLFNPRGVTVIGVSEKPGKLGTSVLRNLVRTGYRGEIVPVHPRLEALEGVSCVASIADLPPTIDVAFLALPADATVEAVEALAAAGVRNVIVGSAGYAEGGEERGIERQRQLGEVADRTGIRVIGPNCNGIYSATNGVSIGFNSGHERKLPAGGIALLSHSGALFDLMARRVEALGGGLSMFVSAGNEVRNSVLDYLDHAIEDEATRVVALLLDALPSAERFRAQAQRATERGKRIVVLKLGSSELGGAAATAHSSRLVGNADAYAAFFASCGVPTVATLEGLMTAAVMMDRYGMRQGGMIGFSTSGAGAALMADLADRHGLAVPAYAPSVAETLAPVMRYPTLLNPTDIGTFTGIERIDEVLDLLTATEGAGIFAALLHTMPGAGRKRIARALADATARRDLPLVILTPGGLTEEAAQDFRDAGGLVLSESDCAFESMAALLAPPALEATAVERSAAALAPLDLGRILTEAESLALLAPFGITVAETRSVASADEAATAAAAIGFPVALKGVVAGVAHKSDAGLVHLHLADAAAVCAAYAAVGTGQAIVQAMRPGDVEAMVGVSHSPDVGPVLVVGLGGVFVEALRQTVTVALPASRATVEHALDRSALGRILASERWKHPGSRAALVDTCMAMQHFALAAGDRLEAAEINPVTIGQAGAIAVDGLVIPR